MLRFRTPEGTFRVKAESSDDFDLVLKQVADNLPGYDPTTFIFSESPTGKPGHSVSQLSGKLVSSLGLKHGDLLFVTIGSKTEQPEESSSGTGINSTNSTNQQSKSAQEILKTVKQPIVDSILDKQDGKIKRQRDPKMCRHGEKSMCEYCMPLEPYDQGYQLENNIKHLSFHSYLRKLGITADSANHLTKNDNATYVPPLTEPFFGVRKNCPTGHAPWPAGICSKCQPSAITLQRQEFRMVDHVQFASSGIINSFVEPWRKTGAQRLGIMYGHYEPYDAVPLGIKAVVEAVYEPPQQDEWDGVTWTLAENIEDKKSKEYQDLSLEQQKVDKVAEFCGLEPVGVIFTDLLDAGMGDGSVVCKRHVDSYFLSSLEICFAAKLQTQARNASKWSTSGQYSSKFVTCVISGNVNNEIDIASYQVSAAAEAMYQADLIEPSMNPSVMRVKERSDARYVPDVFYTRLNEYKRTIQENAKPAFPVEYLLVTLTHGFPKTIEGPDAEVPMFFGESGKFPIENRGQIGESQDMHAVARQLGINRSSGTDIPGSYIEKMKKLSDFHLVRFIAGLGILGDEEVRVLAEAVTQKDEGKLVQLQESPNWATFKMIVAESV